MEEGRADGVLRQGVQDIKGKGRREGDRALTGRRPRARRERGEGPTVCEGKV